MNEDKTTKTTKRITVHLDQDASDVFESILRQIDSPMMPANRTALASVLMQSGCKALESQATAEGKPLRDVLDEFARSTSRSVKSPVESVGQIPTAEELRRYVARTFTAIDRSALRQDPYRQRFWMMLDWAKYLFELDGCFPDGFFGFLHECADSVNDPERSLLLAFAYLVQHCASVSRSSISVYLTWFERYESSAGTLTEPVDYFPDTSAQVPVCVSDEIIHWLNGRLNSCIQLFGIGRWQEQVAVHVSSDNQVFSTEWILRVASGMRTAKDPAVDLGDPTSQHRRLLLAAFVKVTLCTNARTRLGEHNAVTCRLCAQAVYWLDRCERWFAEHPLAPPQPVAEPPAAAPVALADSTATPPVTDAPAMKPVKASREPSSAAGKSKKGKTRA